MTDSGIKRAHRVIAQWESRSVDRDLDAVVAHVRALEASLQRIADMKPHHSGQTPNEYHMQQIARAALQGGVTDE